MTDQSAPKTFPPTELNFPGAIRVNTAAAHLDDDGLYLAFVTIEGWGGTFLFEGDNIEALRESLAAPKMIPATWKPPVLAKEGEEVFVLTPDMVGEPWDAVAAAMNPTDDTLVVS